MGDFLVQAAQCLLTDDLRRQRPHRLIRHRLLVIVHRPFGKAGKNRVQNAVRVDASKRAHRYDLVKWIQPPVHVHIAGHKLLLHGVDLVHDQDHRLFCKLQLRGDEPLPRAAEIGRLHQPQDDIDLREGLIGNIIHVFPQLIFRLVNSGGIQENDLAPVTGIHSPDLAACCLRLCAGDGDLLADQMIHQRGLSHIRPSHDPHEPGTKCFLFHNVLTVSNRSLAALIFSSFPTTHTAPFFRIASTYGARARMSSTLVPRISSRIF